MTALFLQFFQTYTAVPVDGFHFYKGSETLYPVKMKFYVVDKINPAPFIYHGLDAKRLDQDALQVFVGLVLVKYDVRLFGAGQVGTFVKNQGLFNISFPELQAPFRNMEIGVNLVVLTYKPWVVLEQHPFGIYDVEVLSFEFEIDMHKL